MRFWLHECRKMLEQEQLMKTLSVSERTKPTLWTLFSFFLPSSFFHSSPPFFLLMFPNYLIFFSFAPVCLTFNLYLNFSFTSPFCSFLFSFFLCFYLLLLSKIKSCCQIENNCENRNFDKSVTQNIKESEMIESHYNQGFSSVKWIKAIM